MTANEARALMPRNQPTLEKVLATQIYPEIETAAQGDADGVSIYVSTPWVDRIARALRGDGYMVVREAGRNTLSIQWGGGMGG
jgi:hypothetical protein